MAHTVIRGDTRDRLVLVFQTAEKMAVFMVDQFREISDKAIAERGYCSLALSGGKTPVDLYLRLGREGKALDWKKIHVFLVDERFVPHADVQSNYRMIKETLLDSVSIPSFNVHPIPTDTVDAQESARRYEDELVRFFRLRTGTSQVPRFDLVTLGIGGDGHTASLFPGSSVENDEIRLVRGVASDEGMVARVTLTLPVINSAKNVFFIVTGVVKALIAKRVIDERDRLLPAALVAPKEGRVAFLCDREAASLLRLGGRERGSIDDL